MSLTFIFRGPTITKIKQQCSRRISIHTFDYWAGKNGLHFAVQLDGKLKFVFLTILTFSYCGHVINIHYKSS